MRGDRAPRGIEFVTWFWRRQKGRYFFGAHKDQFGRWRERCFPRDKINEFEDWIKQFPDDDAYFCPMAFRKDVRQAAFVEPPFFFWADEDDADPNQKPLPTYRLRTSRDRYQGLWETRGPVTQELNERLTRLIGADASGADYTQMLRVPGTRNRKYAGAPIVRVVRAAGDVYDVAEIVRLLPPAASVRPKRVSALKGRPGASGEAFTVDPHRYRPRDVLRRYLPKRASFFKSRVMNDTNRSRVWFGLAGDLREAGANRDEVASVVYFSRVFKDRAVHRRWTETKKREELRKDVRRIFSKTSVKKKPVKS